MAPKRGGGSGDDGSSLFDDSGFGEKIQLGPGTHFHDPNIRAVTIIYGICFVATCCIAIWAIVVRKNSRRLRWGVLAFSIVTSIIYLGNSIADIMLYDQEATVQVVFFLISTILDSSIYLADISLLGFIYIVIAACLQDLGVKTAIKAALKVSSLVLINILIAFWATILALQIKFQVNEVQRGIFVQGTNFLVINPSKVDLDEVLVWTKLDITYSAIFALASIEILALAMWIISGQRKEGNPTWIGIFLAALVAIPLLIRSLLYLGFLAASLTRDVKEEASVAKLFFTNICFVLAYIGVLLIAIRFKKERPGLGYPGKFGPPQMSSGTWTNAAPVRHQTYPPQGSRYGAPNSPVFGNGTAPHGGAPYGNPSYGSLQHPPGGTAVGYGNPQYSKKDTVTAYQAQDQYNAQYSPVSPVLRENGFSKTVR